MKYSKDDELLKDEYSNAIRTIGVVHDAIHDVCREVLSGRVHLNCEDDFIDRIYAIIESNGIDSDSYLVNELILKELYPFLLPDWLCREYEAKMKREEGKYNILGPRPRK